MARAAWSRLGSPSEVTGARASGDAAVIAVGTSSGHLYLRRRTEAGWRWEHAGTPPGAVEVLDAALLAVEGSNAVTPVVVGDDLRVWLYRPGQAGAAPWIALGGVAPDEDLPFLAECGDITVSTSRGATALVVSSATGRPWIRPGVEPGATWSRLTPGGGLVAVELATALVSGASGEEPHFFALAQQPGGAGSRLRVAVLEDSAWTWIDLGGPAPGGALQTGGLSATSVRDGGGRLRACAVVRQMITGKVGMVTGSGRDWRWADLGRPPAQYAPASAVVAAKGPDPRPGDEPVVIARAGHHIWTRTRTGAWTDLGTTPQDVAVVDPATAREGVAADGRRRVWAAGVSWASDLWTFESDDAGVRWEDHGCPAPVISVPGVSVGPNMMHVVDGYGAVWSCQLWLNGPDGFVNPTGTWTYHGPPAAGVTAAVGVGVLNMEGSEPRPTWVFVVGSDGRLWARTAVDEEGEAAWSWVDHGAPADGPIRTGAAPVGVDFFGGPPAVHVLGDDGRLWMRRISGGDWRWSDRGVPQGQLIFAIVGAAAPEGEAGPRPVAAVVTGDGHLWISVPEGDSFRWSDLGMPSPAEKVVAGIGVETVADDSPAVDIVVVGSPSGQVWSHRWEPGKPGQWTAYGRPAGARVRGGVGTVRPPNEAGCFIAVIGNDQQVWVTWSTEPGTWTRWDPPQTAATVIAGKAVLLGKPCAVVLDEDRRVHVVTAATGERA
ncbi:hypothetical protein ETD83_03465 [Actinomadura soli]|uniref:Uncharacterized protein n=1 Tax=Actinomadura soli TaxID=2508997 RepID=A0A5C4JLA4_9ACTN|nr:hypothetical protein [Actinomadura soli]TMR06736.1 hypothetical protein ETD83_03465 [Actinomadura soli]